MKRLTLLLCLASISGVGVSAPELKGTPQDLRGFLHPTENVVTLYGEAEEKAYSDKAIASLVITTENKLLSKAIARNSALREEVTGLLMKAGVAKAMINSSKFSSSPEYGWFGDKPSKHKVVNRMAVGVMQESHLKEVAVIADKYEAIELSDMTFEHTQKEAYSEKVKASALAKIIKQKAFYETALGLTLTPIGIRDVNIRQQATRGAMALESVMAAEADQEGSFSSRSAKSKYESRARSSSFDEVKYEANLSVDFKIEPMVQQ